MSSSTSRFRARLPLLALVGLPLLVAGLLGLCAAYQVWLNPEVRFWRGALEVKRTWAHRSSAPKAVFCGGSSCAFGLDPAQMEREQGIRAANFGLHAGVGALVILELAMREARPGDTLIVALEPGLLEELEISSLGYQVLLTSARPIRPAEYPEAAEKFTLPGLFGALRPGAYHLFTMAGKLAARRPLYRYDLPDVSESGWVRTAAQYPFGPEPPRPPRVGPGARRVLGQLRDWGTARRVEVFIALPWAYSTEEIAPAARRENLTLVRELGRSLPVLRDEDLGIRTRREEFSDTALHLSEVGARLRTARTGELLGARRIWDEASLAEAGRGLPPR